MARTYFEADFADYTPANPGTLSATYLPALDLTLADGTTDQAIQTLLSPGHRRAFFMNAHCCNTRRHDPAYARAVAKADLLLADGIGVELAAKMTGQKLTANLNGTDLVPALLEEAAKRGKSIFLFGGKPGVADAAAANLIHHTPNLRIAGTRDGYQGAQHVENVIADINESGADIVLVALGVPMQELWLDQHGHLLNATLCMGVGALFDFLAGAVTRAPAIVRRARMEWAWRLLQEPGRMAKRYLAGNFTFLAHAAWTARKEVPAAGVSRRAIDISVCLAALLFLSPILLLTALTIKADSRGPVFFKQTRVGLNGRPFTIFKFRSMTTDAEQRRAALLSTSDREGACFKSRTDPRITRVGRFIRRTSIDELPQILNVLRGEMAIVGPRPALPAEVALYPERAMGRLAVKPGITGVWQVSGRATIGFDEMVEMDLSYAATRTVLLDIALMLQTFRAIASGKGAY